MSRLLSGVVRSCAEIIARIHVLSEPRPLGSDRAKTLPNGRGSEALIAAQLAQLVSPHRWRFHAARGPAVSELGRFLELVYGPSDPFRTARGTIRKWRNRDLAESASGGGRAAMGRRKVGKEAAGNAPKIQEANLSIWISRPGRFRIEKNDKSEEQLELSLIVVNGDQWWSRDHQGHVETSEASRIQVWRRPTPGLTDIERHFAQASLRDYFVGLGLQQSGSAQTAGRSCIRLRAVPRPGAQL